MTRPNPKAYSDVRRVLDAAVAHDGAIYRLDNFGAAFNFRQRCYQYRSAVRKRMVEEIQVPGYDPVTAYDSFVIRIQTPTGELLHVKPQEYKDDPSLMQRPHAVHIAITSQGELVDLNGDPITTETEIEEPIDAAETWEPPV